MTYYVGDVARLTGTFRDAVGTLKDPSSVTLTIDIAGTETVYTTGSGIARLSLGVYRLDYTTTTAGIALYAWDGTGAAMGNRTGTLRVLATSERPAALFGWDPSGDHGVFDGLERVTLTRRNGSTLIINRVLRLPSTADQGNAGNTMAFGAQVNWNIWAYECPNPPEINSRLTDAYGRQYRVDRVVNSVLKSLWEVATTADAGEAI